MERILKTNDFIQLIIWTIVSVIVLLLIFVSNSPHWIEVLTFGLLAQLIGLILNATNGKVNKTWLALTLAPLTILTFIYLESSNSIPRHLFGDVQVEIMTILAVNVLHFMTIFQILKGLRSKRATAF